jgi:cell wall-associated NlpC family hydrolase
MAPRHFPNSAVLGSNLAAGQTWFDLCLKKWRADSRRCGIVTIRTGILWLALVVSVLGLVGCSSTAGGTEGSETGRSTIPISGMPGTGETPGPIAAEPPPALPSPTPELALPVPSASPRQPASPSPSAPASPIDPALLTGDFAERDLLPQTTVSKDKWSSSGSWGPAAATYPPPKIPSGVDESEWKRERVAVVARRYAGLKYKHVHIPAMGGLDCSNYTSWVYNYGLGIKFTSAVGTQGATVGTKLASGDPLRVGDLLYFDVGGGKIGHTGIYLGDNTMIDDSSMNNYSVATKAFDAGWPKSHFAFARRVVR